MKSPTKLNFSYRRNAARFISVGLFFKNMHPLLTQFALNLLRVSVGKTQKLQVCF